MNNDELIRLRKMYEHEENTFKEKYIIIGGADEAGRGPLAGPVVCTVAILPRLKHDADFELLTGLNDSKKLTAKKRNKLFSILTEYKYVHIGIGIASEKIIDRINILKATHLAFRRALSNLDIDPEILFVDGMVINDVNTPQKKINNGDRLSLSIAAASVISKVTRDEIMCRYHKKYPNYAFNKHKGYGTREHIERLKTYGPCKIHRRTFRPISLMQEIGYE